MHWKDACRTLRGVKRQIDEVSLHLLILKKQNQVFKMAKLQFNLMILAVDIVQDVLSNYTPSSNILEIMKSNSASHTLEL